MKKGFYLYSTETDKRCYYLTGEKKGNKWIYLGGMGEDGFVYIENPQWMGLNWMCLLKEDELKDCVYFEYNPTNYLTM